MMLSEQLSGVQNTLSEFIRSQQASGFGSHPCPSSRPRQHLRSTYAVAAAAPPPQPQNDNNDDDGDGDDDDGNGNGDGDGNDHGYDLYSTYNYFNY